MYIEQRKSGPRPRDWSEKAEKAVERFIEEVSDCMNNELFEQEGSPADPEASYLSQYIFRNLFRLFGYKSDYCYEKYIIVDNVRFYFDIMNNPNYENPRNNKQNRMGKKISEKFNEKYRNWKDIYHTLGNFAPYPAIEIENLDIQKFHESKCYERWDLVLQELQNQWSNIDNNDMSFGEYLIATGQIIYDINIFKSLNDENITYEWYLEQSKYILNNDVKIINFNCVCDEKVLNDENVEYAINSLLRLIKVRTKILLMLLRKQKEGLRLKIDCTGDENVLLENKINSTT